MLRKPSNEWDNYIMRLNSIKQKSNREVLCTDCWMILNYEQRGKHAAKFPKHKESILTSSQFASEIQFYHIAFTHNKVVEKDNDVKLIIQPCLFDPKKGSGQIKMLEDLCREMHVTQNTDDSHSKILQNFEESSNMDKFWDSISQDLWEDKLLNKHIGSYKENNEHSDSRWLERISSNLDEMIDSMNELQHLIQTCMIVNQKYDNRSQALADDYDVTQQRSTLKRRKTSEWDSWFNYQSQETTYHPPSVAESIFTNQLRGKYPNYDDKIMTNYNTQCIIRISDPQKTAFTPFQSEWKKDLEASSSQKMKIHKPVPLPSLNSLVGRMCPC